MVEIQNIDEKTTKISYDNVLELVLKNMPEYYYVNCKSSSKEIRALEFMDYLFEQYGIEEGTEFEAEGRISKVILGVYVSEMKAGSVEKYFKLKMEEYLSDTDVVDSLREPVNVTNAVEYKKKMVPWAFVVSTDIAEEGTEIIIRSLENTTGTTIISSENAYIMIGIKGEVYDIRREKFENSYVATEEPLDIFEQMRSFMPAVECGEDRECISIDEYAKLCYPKPGGNIYAIELKKRTKVFGYNNRQDYFVGRPGDFLAVRMDDVRDVYVIKRDIFHSTYEQCE